MRQRLLSGGPMDWCHWFHWLIVPLQVRPLSSQPDTSTIHEAKVNEAEVAWRLFDEFKQCSLKSRTTVSKLSLCVSVKAAEFTIIGDYRGKT